MPQRILHNFFLSHFCSTMWRYAFLAKWKEWKFCIYTIYKLLYTLIHSETVPAASHRGNRRSSFFSWLACSPRPIVIHRLTFDFILERNKNKKINYSATSRSPFSGSMRTKCRSRSQNNVCRMRTNRSSRKQTHNDIKWQIAKREKNITLYLNSLHRSSFASWPNQHQHKHTEKVEYSLLVSVSFFSRSQCSIDGLQYVSWVCVLSMFSFKFNLFSRFGECFFFSCPAVYCDRSCSSSWNDEFLYNKIVKQRKEKENNGLWQRFPAPQSTFIAACCLYDIWTN